MVSWAELRDSIALNAYKTHNVQVLTSTWKSFPIERFPITVRSRPAFVEEKPAVAVRVPSPPVLPTKSPRLLIVDDDDEYTAAPPPSAPAAPLVPPQKTIPASAPAAPTAKKLTHKPIDPITLGIEHREPLYTTAGQAAKKQMECEEAQRIEGELGELYKSQGGRSRGWTKTLLEGVIRPRCASGGDISAVSRCVRSGTSVRRTT